MRHRADEPLPDTRRPPGHWRGPDTCFASTRPRRGAALRTRARAIRRNRFAPSGIAAWRIRCRVRVGRPAPYAEPAGIFCAHRLTVGEVQNWFNENGVEYVRTYPSALLGETPADLLTAAADTWSPEAWLAQLSWMRSLGHEGGLFVTVGRRQRT